MSGKQAVLAVLVVGMCILGRSAAAQDEKNELTGMLGRIFISDQGIQGPNAPTVNPFVRSGKGLTFEINYARHLLGTDVYAISAEVPAVFNLDEDLGSGGDVVPSGYQQIFVTPAVRLNLFPATRVTPWVSLGAVSAISARARISTITAPIPEAHQPLVCFKPGLDWT